MRESIGGTWLFGIVITFIALFAAFLSYAISYTKAFNLKSEILNMIERAEGWTDSDEDVTNLAPDLLEAETTVEAKAYSLVKSMGYNYTAVKDIDCASVKGHESYEARTGSSKIEAGGYCVTRYCEFQQSFDPVTGLPIEEINVNTKSYYKVTTFIAVKIPVIELVLTIPISGETRTLFYDHGEIPCTSIE